MRGRDSVKLQEVTEIPGDSMGFNGIFYHVVFFPYLFGDGPGVWPSASFEQ